MCFPKFSFTSLFLLYCSFPLAFPFSIFYSCWTSITSFYISFYSANYIFKVFLWRLGNMVRIKSNKSIRIIYFFIQKFIFLNKCIIISPLSSKSTFFVPRRYTYLILITFFFLTLIKTFCYRNLILYLKFYPTLLVINVCEKE